MSAARHWSEVVEARAEELSRTRRLDELHAERAALTERLKASGVETSRARARRLRLADVTTLILQLELGRTL